MSFSEKILPEIEVELRRRSEGNPLDDLAWLAKQFENRAVFSTSFGIEDQVITHLIFEHSL